MPEPRINAILNAKNVMETVKKETVFRCLEYKETIKLKMKEANLNSFDFGFPLFTVFGFKILPTQVYVKIDSDGLRSKVIMYRHDPDIGIIMYEDNESKTLDILKYLLSQE